MPISRRSVHSAPLRSGIGWDFRAKNGGFCTIGTPVVTSSVALMQESGIKWHAINFIHTEFLSMSAPPTTLLMVTQLINFLAV